MSKQWWKESVVYQIYPRSFKDSNHDGIGDLAGILEKVDYLVWLGVQAVWLNPIYDSPNDDMGYDIRDYEEIMTEFGTMADFDRLLEALHRNGIKLIMDLVVNHSSDEHAWFVESRKSTQNPYRDYYLWRTGKDGQEPNNWASFFTPSAWTRDPVTDQWYLHLFSEKQPDLNWENPRLRQEVYAMMNRWFDRGVDGFRMDVINLIAKNPGLPDGTKPSSGKYVFSDEHFANQPRLTSYLKEMKTACFANRDCMCVGETPFVTPQNASTIVDAETMLDMIFHFELMDIDSRDGKWDFIPFDVRRFKRLMADWQAALPWNSLFWSNHDQPRTVSRFGDDTSEQNRVASAKMLGVALHLMKGTSFIYQGEEIGMTNVPFRTVSDLRDIESLQFMKNAEAGGYQAFAWRGILKKGRDNARTPMQWNDAFAGGFSDSTPWIMANPNYRSINVQSQQRDPDSILNFYRTLIAMKTTSQTLMYGDFHLVDPDHPAMFVYTRSMPNERYCILCNMTSQPCEYALPEACSPERLVLSNDRNPTARFLPYEARVYRLPFPAVEPSR